MVTFKIALRYLLRRKKRMVAIGCLVFLGTLIITLGGTISRSAKKYSQESIINFFTGDCIVYSSRSKEKPSPFSFTTPLPIIEDVSKVEAWLQKCSFVDKFVSLTQNYGMLSVDTGGKSVEVPFFFYAVDPKRYLECFQNISMESGSFFSKGNSYTEGIVLSREQADNYARNYGVTLVPGVKVTLLSLTDGGSVNAYPSGISGIYQPLRYRNVFNYINFIDIGSYAKLFNFTGVEGASLPESYREAFSSTTDESIFGLADNDAFETLATKDLTEAKLSGYTLIAIKLKRHNELHAFTTGLSRAGFEIAVAPWNEASSFFANIAAIVQAIIYGATSLIFLIVIFILMNTFIISILERTSEIGTLRALGGEKGFITSIFIWEAFLLNGAAALAGMFASSFLIITVKIVGGLPLPEIVSQYLIGGGKLPLLLTVNPFLEALLSIIIVSLLSTVYPVRVATSIPPLKAMSGK